MSDTFELIVVVSLSGLYFQSFVIAHYIRKIANKPNATH